MFPWYGPVWCIKRQRCIRNNNLRLKTQSGCQIDPKLANLIKNGCEAQNNKGKIILKTSYNASKKFLLNENDLPEFKPLQVEVIDFGIGISETDLQNIFDPFITKKQDGKGLGLSIVSNAIRTLDGSIEVNSENGRTIFCVNFPLKKSEGLV